MKIISLTISLDHFTPKIWRRIWVKDSTKLDRLCEILYTSMGWSGSHLSEIRAKSASYGNTEIDPPDNILDWKKYTIKDIIKTGVKKFTLLYDFGDGWEMTVKMKGESKLDPNAPYPVCVNGENAAPPEDVGSYPGYARFIEVMTNPKHPEHNDLCEWYGEDIFDPAYFSVDEVNSALQKL